MGKGIRQFKGSLTMDDKDELRAGQDHHELAAGKARVSGEASSKPLDGPVATDDQA
jgi:hypothetical protein